MLTDIDADIANSSPTSSPTAHLLDELQLFGWRPNGEEPDPRPLPEAARAEGAVADMVDALVATLEGTRLEADLEGLLWSLVYLFHRHVGVVGARSTATSRISESASATRTAPKFARSSLSG